LINFFASSLEKFSKVHVKTKIFHSKICSKLFFISSGRGSTQFFSSFSKIFKLILFSDVHEKNFSNDKKIFSQIHSR
jgi:hypothetical protein